MPSAPLVHPAPDELAAYGLGKLNDLAAGYIVKHLDECTACRALVENVPQDSFLALLKNAQKETLHHSTCPTPSIPGASFPLMLEIPDELANHLTYRIVRALGRGGMGEVFLAEQRGMDRLVAVKIVSQGLVDNAEVLSRFQREVKVIAKLNHTNIVQAYAYEQIQGLHLLVMEYVDGLSLDRVVQKKGPLSLVHSCHFVRQAALGLQHAHENGLVHRDIKPHNMMLTQKNVIKVLDFGLALLAHRSQSSPGLTSANMLMGTPDYMAPEQASSARTADIRADIYALGCTLYHLLTGKPPFPEGEWLDKVLAHTSKPPVPLIEKRPDLPPALSDLVGRMMAKIPADRPATPGEVAKALGTFVKQQTAKVDATPQMSPTGIVRKPAATQMRSNSGLPKQSTFEKLDKPVSAPAASKAVRSRWPLVAAGIGLVLALAAGGLFTALKIRMPDGGILVLDGIEPNSDVFIDGQTVKVEWPGGGGLVEIKVEKGSRFVMVKHGAFQTKGEKVEVGSGKTTFKVAYIPQTNLPKALEEKPSLSGLWDVVFSNGDKRSFIFADKDHDLVGNNGWSGKWEVKGDKVVLVGPTGRDNEKWEGELDPTNTTMKLTYGLVSAVFVRSEPTSQETTNSMAGLWDASFWNGSESVFTLREDDHVIIGNNGWSGRWERVGNRVVLIGPVPRNNEKWDGVVDKLGKEMNLTLGNASARFVRREKKEKDLLQMRKRIPAYDHGGGKWRIEGEELILDPPGVEIATLWFGDPSWKNYEVKVDVKLIDGTGPVGVVFRCQDVLNWWVFMGDPRQGGLVVRQGADSSEGRAPTRWARDRDWHTMRVVVNEDHIECFLDLAQIYDFRDSRHPSGYVGLASVGTSYKFKNLRVADAAGQVLLSGIQELDLASDKEKGAPRDIVKEGAIFKGNYTFDNGGFNSDATLRITKREGSKFEGELLIQNGGLKTRIEGNIDATDNISWRSSLFLPGSPQEPKQWLEPIIMGRLSGKQIHGYGYFTFPRQPRKIGEFSLELSK